MNFCFLAIAFFAFSTLPLLATLTEPPVRTEPELAVPVFDAELVVKADNTEIGFWYLYFDTIPYYLYSMEESQDMVTWTPSPTGYFYGDGTPMKSFVCEGPMPAVSTGSGGGTSGVGQPLRTLNIEITKVENLNINGYHLLRRSYTPSPDSPAYNPWDVLRSDDPLPFQTEGIRLFSFFSWTDPATNILWWVDATVTTLPQSTNGVPNALPTDSLAATDEEPDELAIFDAIKPQLIARLAVPPNLFPEPSASGPRKFARLRRTPADSNQNGLPDWWEVQYGFDPFAGNEQEGFCYPGGDPDHDGLTNLKEFLYATDPNDDDSDNDNLKDGREVLIGTQPTQLDSDNDGLTDGEEVLTYQTNALQGDTDRDQLSDFEEVTGIPSVDQTATYITNPRVRDTDRDGLTDYEEIHTCHTDPTNPDTDGDGHNDGYEVKKNRNPKDPNDYPEEPDDPDNPVGSSEIVVVGESMQLYYNYLQISPPSILITSPMQPFTSGSVIATNSWNTSIHFEPITSQGQRISAPGLTGHFGAQLPDASECFNAAASANGIFSKNHRYLVPGGSEDSDDSLLSHSRIVLRSYSPKHAAFTRNILVITTRQVLGAEPTVTEELMPLSIAADEPVSAGSVDLTPSFEETNEGTEYVSIEAPSAEITLDKGMVGAIGDIVPSAKSGSTMRHFVTPKEVGKFVDLKADLMNTQDFATNFKWEGEGIIAAGDKCKIKRDTTGFTHVKIKSKNGTVVSEMFVWVVWATCTPTVGVGVLHQGNTTAYYGIDDAQPWKFLFKILPETIITAAERPALNGISKQPTPGALKIYPIIPSLGAGDTALAKWDVSRQLKDTIQNEQLIPAVDLSWPTVYLAGQPAAATTLFGWPTNSAEGNDDPLFEGGIAGDENDNPYTASTTPGFSHDVGELISGDAPDCLFMKNSAGAAGRTLRDHVDFREFCRLELWDGTRKNGRFWYRISDFSEWHVASHLEWDGTTSKWKDVPASPSATSTGNLHP